MTFMPGSPSPEESPMNSLASRNRKKPNTQTPEQREDWDKTRDALAAQRIRAQIEKNRQDPVLQRWAALGAEVDPNSPALWLVDSVYLLRELQRIRELVQNVPLSSLAMSLPLQTVTDAIWSLERQLRDILAIHRDGQRAFAKQQAPSEKPARSIRKAKSNIVRISA
jgi:hypothetical protein